MNNKKQKIEVFITTAQKAKLKIYADSNGISMAEVLKRSLIEILK